MKYLIALILLATIYTFTFFAFIDVNIKGKVTDDATGDPISGVTIQLKNTGTATTTNESRNFTIPAPDSGAIIICSMIGYQNQEITIGKPGKSIHIKMKVQENKLEETMVMGYGISNQTESDSYQSRLGKPLQGIGAGIAIMNGKNKSTNRNNLPAPDFNTEDYNGITENRFLQTTINPLSTFSIDVDGASYSNIRRFLQTGQLPPSGSVRIEEMINYFHYNYPQPMADDPFSINTEIADCPWNKDHHLVMIGLQGKKIPFEHLPASNLVFLIDVSGSMMDENKLPLVQSSMKLLIEQLREQDRVSIVVYAGNAGLVLPSTSGDQKQKIKDAIDGLEAGGSTAGGEGIQLAYKVARDNFMNKGNNRVILCTDGDFNVGASSDAALEKMIEGERKSGVFLTVLGYGMGNYKDNKMQTLADKGNGNHAYIDNIQEAKKVLVSEFGGTLFTIAKDVKLQVEFNPSAVQGYRLIGYENRMLNKEDFNNDKNDAGEIGSGHTVTALYEIIPVGIEDKWVEKTDDLKYQDNKKNMPSGTDEIMTVKFRYKNPDGDKSRLITHVIINSRKSLFDNSSDNFRFAAAVAQFGMLLGNSEFRQDASLESARKLASRSLGNDEEGYRKEFISLLNKATRLFNEEKISRK